MDESENTIDDRRAELVAYLDGELDAAGTARVETLLRTDPQFRAEADAYQQTWKLLDELPRTQPLPTFASRTLERIDAVELSSEQPTWTPANWRRLGWGVALLAAAFLGFALTPSAKMETDLDRDPVYKSDPRLIENLPLYLAVENWDFLRSLDSNDLFGEDAVGR